MQFSLSQSIWEGGCFHAVDTSEWIGQYWSLLQFHRSKTGLLCLCDHLVRSESWQSAAFQTRLRLMCGKSKMLTFCLRCRTELLLPQMWQESCLLVCLFGQILGDGEVGLPTHHWNYVTFLEASLSEHQKPPKKLRSFEVSVPLLRGA